MADTRRDIIERVRVNGEDVANVIAACRNFYDGDPAVAGPLKTYIDNVNANVAAITASMAAFAAAAP